MIRLQFVGGGDLQSEIIEWFSHGLYSHVDAILPNGSLLGARMSGGVAIRPPDYEKFGRKLVVELPASAAMEQAFYGEILREVGKPYDTTAIAAFAADRNWREDDSWYCSELHGAKLEAVGWFPFPLAAPASKITPVDLLLAISARARLAA